MTIAVRVEHTDVGASGKLRVGYVSKKGRKKEEVKVLTFGEGIILHVYSDRDIFVEEVIEEPTESV